MAIIIINSLEFNGLAIEIIVDDNGMRDAHFASSGNPLPMKMYDRLCKNKYDQSEISSEYEAYKYFQGGRYEL